MDFTSVCRTCLTSDNLCPVFNPENQTRFIDAVRNVAGIMIDHNDGLPQKICTDCMEFLKKSISFRDKCIKADLELRKIQEALIAEVEIEYEIETEVLEYIDISTLKDESPKKTQKIKTEDATLSMVKNEVKEKNTKKVGNTDRDSSDIPNMVLPQGLNSADNGKVFRCGNCKIEYSDGHELIEHIATCYKKRKEALGSRTKITPCDLCGRRMKRKSLYTHHARVHGGMPKPICEHCGKAFASKGCLVVHLRAHHGHAKLQCAECPFQSSSAYGLQSHERRHHLKEKPFICEVCGAKFHARHILGAHLQTHRTDRPIKCDQCPATFKANNSLYAHRRLHHGGGKAECETCGERFPSKDYLTRHKRKVHT